MSRGVVGNEISIIVIAFDGDIEHILNGFAMQMKRAQVEWLALIHIRGFPLFLYFSKRQFVMAQKRVEKPKTSLIDGDIHIILLIFGKDIKSVCKIISYPKKYCQNTISYEWIFHTGSIFLQKKTIAMNRFRNITELMFGKLQPFEWKTRQGSAINYRQTVPKPCLPDGFTDSRAYLRHLVFQKARKKFGKDLPVSVRERIEQELAVITIKDGWADHFVNIRHAMIEARETISGCLTLLYSSTPCSFVSHLLGLTHTNPLKYGLPFETFFNVSTRRIPDVCIIVDDESKNNFISMLKEWYGDKMSSVIVTMKNNQEVVSNCFWAFSREDMPTIMPMRKIQDPKTGMVHICPDFANHEDIQTNGGTFLHILSMSNVSLLTQLLDLIGIPNPDKFDFLSSIPLDDVNTLNSFYDRSDGNVPYVPAIGKLKSRSISELSVMDVLSRPILDVNISEYIRRRNSRSTIDYPIPEMADVLEETKGLIVYKEQIFLLARQITGMEGKETAKMLSAFRFNDSERLRSYYLPRFLDGGREKGYSADLLEEIFMSFWHYGNYTLGKGQQIEKTIHKYQIAYLKTHYPKEYQLVKDAEMS